MAQFDLAINYLLPQEGVIEDQAADPGGITKFGISLKFLKGLSNEKLRNYGFSATAETINRPDVEQLTLAQAKALYKGEFWDHAPFEKINNQDVCNYIFDMAVNMWIAPAIKCVQRAIWAVAQQRNIVAEDGILGHRTLDFINECDIHLLAAIRSERAGDYRVDAVLNPAEGKVDLNGWLNRAYNKKEV